MDKIDYSILEVIIWAILKVQYVLSFVFLIAAFFFPYYSINGTDHYLFRNFDIFPLYFIIFTFIAVFSNIFMMFKVKINQITKSDYYSIIPLTLIVLTERLWQPLINPNINDTPGLSIGIFFFHGAITVQWLGVYLYSLKKQNDSIMQLPS